LELNGKIFLVQRLECQKLMVIQIAVVSGCAFVVDDCPLARLIAAAGKVGDLLAI
jgi:hypothetical protein